MIEDMSKIKPRILPRSILDILICMPAMIIQMLLVFAVPVLMVFLLTRSEILSLFVFLMVWGFFLLGGVRYLLIDESGISLKRVVGVPKFISWDDLESVEISSPFNTIIYGWLWPPVPAREMTYSLSAHEHVQFTYSGGKRTFFPPKHTQQLLDLIYDHKAKALTKPST